VCFGFGRCDLDVLLCFFFVCVQMRASGDPYLQHCLETAVLLALIGANSTVVAAGLLHDSLDDAFLTYDYIVGVFGTGVADLVEGVRNLSVVD